MMTNTSGPANYLKLESCFQIPTEVINLQIWLPDIISLCLIASIDNCQCHARFTLQWRHYGRDGVSNHQPLHCLLNRLFRHRTKKTAKVRVTGLCEGNSPVNNSPVTGEFPTQRASNAENVSIWWHHHVFDYFSIPGTHFTKGLWAHHPNLQNKSCCSHLENEDLIWSKFSICHDSSAVVPCAKFMTWLDL